MEFICTTTEIRLRWIVSVASTPHTFILNMESSTSWPFNLTTELVRNSNSTRVSFLRLSAQNMLPMVESLLFNPTSAELNGTQVTCVGRDKNSATVSETLPTLITVMDEDLVNGRLKYTYSNISSTMVINFPYLDTINSTYSLYIILIRRS